MRKHKMKTGAAIVGLAVLTVSGQIAVHAQEAASSAEEAQTSEFVTINVKDANIAEVLKAYSLQTGQSIVVGPDVVSDRVNVRLNNIPWQEALDVILKPYGFGYQVVGDTIVINKLDEMANVEQIEPLVSEVIELLYIDAYDIKEVCEAQLSSRGKISIPVNKGLPGWEFGGVSRGSSSSQSGLSETKRQKSGSV
ncbi:MAG TPA: secretin and TonB N-terminal domain-containing protein, partial [Pontiella sp.]